MTHLDFLVERVDYARAKSLVFLLRPRLFRLLYRSYNYRISLGFIFTMLFYFPLSLIRPDILLFTGPLLFGYPHLMASFRFIRPKSAHLFVGLTVLCILGHLYFRSKIPFGVWQILVAFSGVIFTSFFSLPFSFFRSKGRIFRRGGGLRESAVHGSRHPDPESRWHGGGRGRRRIPHAGRHRAL